MTVLLLIILGCAALAAGGGYGLTRQLRGAGHRDTGAAPTGGRSASTTATSTTATSTTAAPTPTVPAAVAGAARTPAGTAAPAPGALPLPAGVRAATRAALAAVALGTATDGVVVDLDTGQRLLSDQPNTAAPPASTTKLTTATAALAVVGGTTRLTTRIVAGRTVGQLVLVGGGDPTLSAAAPGKPTLYPNAARLSTLVAQLRRHDHHPITSIVIDTSLYTGSALGPGWQPDDVPSSYASAIQALVVDGGLPATGGDQRSAQPALEAGRALARLLGHPNLPVTSGRARPGARVLASVRSAPVLDLIEQALLTSDNVIAEMLGRQVALAEHEPASFAGAAAGVRRALAGVGFHLPATLVDASGLSRRDRLTPAELAGLLRLDAGTSHPVLNQLISALPVAGWEGTLALRYKHGASRSALGRVRAKTGTLSGVVALAGLVRDRSGRLLVFAFIAHKVPMGGTVGAEAALDNVVSAIAACGCR